MYLRDDVLVFAKVLSAISVRNIVVTPYKAVHLCFSIQCSVAAGS